MVVSPLRDPKVAAELRQHIKDFAQGYGGDFDRYFRDVMEQDAWDEPIGKLGEELAGKIEDYFDAIGEYPSVDYVELSSAVEREVFNGRCIDDEIGGGEDEV